MREIITTYGGLYIARTPKGFGAFQSIEDLAGGHPVIRCRQSVNELIRDLDRIFDPSNWEGGDQND